MRTSVHLVLFLCAIVMAVGAFGPFVGVVEARHIHIDDLRNGFAAGLPLDRIAGRSVSLQGSLTLILLIIALVVLVAALSGSRAPAGLGVLAGLIALGLVAWRLNERFDDQLRSDYRHLLSGVWGLYLFGGGVAVALLALLVPGERVRRRPGIGRF